MLAHEVRNPLGILRSSAQLLSRQQGLDARSREMLGFMLGECDRINDLISSLLDNARPREPVFAAHDLNGLVEQLLDMLAARALSKRVSVDFEPAPLPLDIHCDRDQIVQVILNLVLNAIQAAGDKGRVRIRTWRDPGVVCLEIADDGPGIPAERRAAVLEPFVSGREGGIGLGLTVVQDVLRRHRAEFEIGDADLGGASFRVRFPANDTDPSA